LQKYKSAHRHRFVLNRLFIFAIACIVFAVGLGVGYLIGGDNGEPECTKQAMVSRVIDGDTVELVDGQRVRYLGIDTPEVGQSYSSEATERNKELVEGKVVELQLGKRDKDEYGRLLRYVYVDGTFVNAELVAEGLATAFIFDPDDPYSQTIVQLEQYAKMRKQGLWSGNETL